MPNRVSILYTPGDGGKLGGSSYTDGADTKVDEIMVLGEQHLPTYVIDMAATSVATANDHLLQIMAGATNNVYIKRIRIYQSATATTAAIATIAIFRLTTAGTGGTGVNVEPLDTTDTAGATAMTLPSSKGTESTRLYQLSVGYTQTVPAAGVNPLLLELDFDTLRTKALRIAAGTSNGIAIKHISAVAAATAFVTVELTEAPY